MAILIKFTNPNVDDITLNVYRGDSELDRANLPAPIATLTGRPTEFLDKTAIQGKTYFYVFEAVGNNDRDISRNIKLIAAETRGPGNNILKEGTRDLGYYDTLAAADVMDLNTFFAKIGNPTGFSASNFTYWVKFARNGKVLFVPSSYVGIANLPRMKEAGFFDDGKLIEHNGFKYRVRLMRGYSETDTEAQTFIADKVVDTDYNMESVNATCEFNDLVYPLVNVTPLKQRLANKINTVQSTATGGRYIAVREMVGDEALLAFRSNTVTSTSRDYIANLRFVANYTGAFAFWPVLELIEV